MLVAEVPINTSHCREEAQLVLHTSGDHNFELPLETLCLNCPFRVHMSIPTSSGTCTSPLSSPSRANPTTREFQPSEQRLYQVLWSLEPSRREERKSGREGYCQIRTERASLGWPLCGYGIYIVGKRGRGKVKARLKKEGNINLNIKVIKFI